MDGLAYSRSTRTPAQVAAVRHVELCNFISACNKAELKVIKEAIKEREARG